MSYDLTLVRKEVKDNSKSKNLGKLFEKKPESIIPFTEIQIESLKRSLISYGFIKEGETETLPISYKFKKEEFGIRATLYNNSLSMQSGFNEDGVFEICQTASELCDNENFAYFDFQNGSWTDCDTWA